MDVVKIDHFERLKFAIIADIDVTIDADLYY